MDSIGTGINKFLKSVGGEAQGSFKVFSTHEPNNSRTHIFLKMDNLPGDPAIDFSIDLPGDLDHIVAQGANAGLKAAGVGNAPEAPPSTT